MSNRGIEKIEFVFSITEICKTYAFCHGSKIANYMCDLFCFQNLPDGWIEEFENWTPPPRMQRQFPNHLTGFDFDNQPSKLN